MHVERLLIGYLNVVKTMRTYVFTDRERRILESHLSGGKVDKRELSKIMDKLRKRRALFEDIYLYLSVRKTMTS